MSFFVKEELYNLHYLPLRLTTIFGLTIQRLHHLCYIFPFLQRLNYVPKFSSKLHLPSCLKVTDALQTSHAVQTETFDQINPLNPKLNPICYLLALLGAHHFLHVSRIRVKLLTLRRLMSYVYGAPILDVSRSYTTTQHSR